MPPYWTYRRRRWRTTKRRRPYFRTWRARQTFRRNKYKRRWRRHRKVKRRRFKKKLSKITIKQFQPKSIKKCKVKGTKCLFQGSPLRSNNNFIQYIYSYTPEHQPGGGGWTLIIHSLETLYEDWLHLENIWTETNAGLPLIRYLGCSFKFYQSQDTDYVVVYDNCWPMVDTELSHADAAPQRMLQKQHKIIIPSLNTRKKRKPYKKIWVKPPSQMYNHWYFSRDICKTPLVMLTATAVDLRNPFARPEAMSNNISLTCLNVRLFQNTNFQHPPETSYYSPKMLNNTEKMYLYGTYANHNEATINDLFPLGNSKQLQLGKPYKQINSKEDIKLSNLGNPFHSDINDKETFTVYYSTKPFTDQEWFSNKTQKLQQTNYLQILDSPYYITVRYNPDKDTGAKNKIYLVRNYEETNWTEPNNKNLILEGLPLYYMLWGWLDWQKKLKEAVRVFNDYTLVIITDQFDVELPYYVLIDDDFRDGFEPYGELTTPHVQPSQYTTQNWFPKTTFQEQSIQHICDTGPFTPKPPWKHYLQARYSYQFHFKLGGCPKLLKKPSDPCLQSKWTTPDNIARPTQITNPSLPPETELYSWDWEEDYVKRKAIKRIKQYTPADKNILSITESTREPPPLKKRKTTTTSETEEEEENNLLQQLLNLRQQRQQLQQLLQLEGIP
nr:MAG: ORF1 [TTV-like mini virus]